MISNALSEIMDLSIDLIPQMIKGDEVKKDEINAILNSSRSWLRNLYIFDAIFDYEREKKKEVTISLEYDLPRWYLNDDESIFNLKKKIDYKMTYNDSNEHLNNELISLFGKEDKIFAVGKYFHQMQTNIKLIQRTATPQN